jgi:hypothetical protein
MKRLSIIGTALCFVLGLGWSALGQVSLEGKTYTGTLTSKKDGKTYPESIIFGKDKIRSTACEAQGFKAGKYIATEKDGTTTVKGSVMNAKGDMNEIEATITGDALSGTLTGKTADGTMGETFTLTATHGEKAKQGEHPKREHPAKTEHPAAEHPR